MPPWLEGVRGEQVIPLINADVPALRVRSGPGTGKTFGLRRRVLRLLHPDGLGQDPARVLVCSFNRVIANELREEIAAELAPYGLAPPIVSTVHSLCARLLGESSRILLPHEEDAMVYDVREKHPDLNEAYGRRQSVALAAIREHEAGIADHPALVTAINEWLADHGARRIGDVTRDAATGLDAGDIDFEPFDHIIVDEFQDLSATEALVLVRLLAPGGTFVGLGDGKQSIYSFRGNDARGLEAMPDIFDADVTDHTMNECQRCCVEVVELGNGLMALEGEPLVSVREGNAQVVDVYFDQPSHEIRRCAEEITRVHGAAPADRILVLVTRRFWGYEIRNAVRKLDENVDVETSFAEDVLETWQVREAFMLLEALADPDPVSLRSWVAYKGGADPQDYLASARNAPAYVRLKEARGVLRRDAIPELAQLPLSEFGGTGRQNVRDRLALLRDHILELSSIDDVRVLIEVVLGDERWLNAEAENADLAAEDLSRLRSEAQALLDEQPELTPQRLVQQLRLRIATREPLGRKADAAIQIVTLWGAKGLTADVVFVAGLVDQALPGTYDPATTHLTEGEWLAEQRRLLYVSLTRAKKVLVLSRPQHISKNAALTLGLRLDSGAWDQRLTRTRFFSDVAGVPAAVRGADWDGVDLALLS